MNKEFLEVYEKLMNEDVELALEFCEDELKKTNSADIYIYIADCFMSLEDYESAIATIDKALKLGCKSTTFANSLKGEALFYLGKYIDSKKIFLHLLKENPDSFFSIAYLTDIDINLKNYEEGIKRALEVISRNTLNIKDKAYILSNVAWIKLKYLNRKEEALRIFNEALELDSNLASVYIGLGEYYLILKDYKNALENFQQALDLGECTIDVFLSLGLCFKGIGNLESAREYFQIVYNADRNNKIAVSELQK